MTPAPPQLTAEQLAVLPDPTVDLLTFVAGAAAFGDVVSFELGGVTRTLVNDADAAFDFLREARDETRDIPINAATAAVAGDGLLLTTGSSWQPRRLVIQRELSHRRVRDHATSFVTNIQAALQEWSGAGTIDLQQRVGTLTLDNLGDTVFATDFRPVRALLSTITDLLLRSADAANSGRSVADIDARLHASVVDLDRLIQLKIDDRHHRDTQGRDILGVLSEAARAGDAIFNDRWVRDEAVTLIIAGHDTTAFLSTMALVCLARNPDVLQDLRGQLQAAERRGVLRTELVDEVPLTRLVLEETLRLFPPVSLLHRLVVEPTTIAGWSVSPGSLLVFSPWVQHRDPRNFRAPDVFDPQRFARERRSEFGHAYIPFGAGRRICAGNHFALFEAAMIVALASLDYQIELASAAPPVIVSTVSLHVGGGVSATVIPLERPGP